MVQSGKHGTARRRGFSARQIYEALKDQILQGAFGTDGKLPSSRALALELGVSRTTVTVAYEQLFAEGFTDVRQGARPRVAAAVVGQHKNVRPAKHSGPIRLSTYGRHICSIPPWIDYAPSKLLADFRYGDLSPSDFPMLLWKRAVNAAVGLRPERLSYDDPRGSRRLRMALQGYLWRARTLRCDLEQIIIVSGSQQGLDLCARLLLDPTEHFAIEDPCYSMAGQIFESTGATRISIPVDGEGLKTDALAKSEARLAYVTPSHQFPLGSIMPISRRHQLLEWARRSEAYVIEDDYDSEYRYDVNPVPPLHGLEDSSNVIYLGTISKTLSPTLRIGYLVVPSDLQQVFSTAKQLTDRHSPLTEQEALASLIQSGAYERHVRRVRRLNSERRETLLNALQLKFADRILIQGADAGLHVVVWFKDLPLSMEATLIEKARQLGVGIYAISRLYDQASNNIRSDQIGLVMGYAALESRLIERGVQLLAEAVDLVSSSAKEGKNGGAG